MARLKQSFTRRQSFTTVRGGPSGSLFVTIAWHWPGKGHCTAPFFKACEESSFLALHANCTMLMVLFQNLLKSFDSAVKLLTITKQPADSHPIFHLLMI